MDTTTAASSEAARLRQDRDRYVGFAFAAADALLELGADNRILTISGAAQALFACETASLVGKDFLGLVGQGDRGVVARVLHGLRWSGRVDSVSIKVLRADGSFVPVLLGGCRLPTMPDRAFASLALIPPALAAAAAAVPRDPVSGLLEKDSLLEMAKRAGEEAGGAPRHLTMLHMDGLQQVVRDMSKERSEALLAEIGATLRACSVGGDLAGRIDDDQFGFVSSNPDQGVEAKRLTDELGAVARSAGLQPQALTPKLASIGLATGGLDEHEAAKAIAYAIKRFSETRGDSFTLTTLAEGLAAAVESSVERFGDFRRVIRAGEFNLVFQPIVGLDDRKLHHFEALARFADNKSPFEMITFGEEVGLIQEFDLEVCRKAIAALEGSAGHVVAVNVSGRSVQTEQFRSQLNALLAAKSAVRDRLIFELTESSAVEEVDAAAAFLRWLREEGYAVCLDDFGAGAAAYSYLRHFDVDFVKIDGPFLKAAIGQTRERALVRSIARLCEDLRCGVIGEMIEDQAGVTACTAMGIRYGQGWFFGKPVPALPPAEARPAAAKPAPPKPTPPKEPEPPGPPRNFRRKGATESWG